MIFIGNSSQVGVLLGRTPPTEDSSRGGLLRERTPTGEGSSRGGLLPGRTPPGEASSRGRFLQNRRAEIGLFPSGKAGGRNARSGRVGSGRAGPGRFHFLHTLSTTRRFAPTILVASKGTPKGSPTEIFKKCQT